MVSVDKHLAGLGVESGEKVWQIHYQWISIIFCFQALCFYLPYYLWQNWEAGHMNCLVVDLGKYIGTLYLFIRSCIYETRLIFLGGPILSSSWTKSKKEALVNYISKGNCLQNIYAGRYVLCEILNLINVVSFSY